MFILFYLVEPLYNVSQWRYYDVFIPLLYEKSLNPASHCEQSIVMSTEITVRLNESPMNEMSVIFFSCSRSLLGNIADFMNISLCGLVRPFPVDWHRQYDSNLTRTQKTVWHSCIETGNLKQVSFVVFTLHDDLGKATEEIIATSTRAASLQELADV